MVHDDYGTVLEVNKTGPSKHLWYSAALPLPYDLGSINNPVFAVYPGGNWNNETFQKIVVRADSIAFAGNLRDLTCKRSPSMERLEPTWR